MMVGMNPYDKVVERMQIESKVDKGKDKRKGKKKKKKRRTRTADTQVSRVKNVIHCLALPFFFFALSSLFLTLCLSSIYVGIIVRKINGVGPRFLHHIEKWHYKCENAKCTFSSLDLGLLFGDLLRCPSNPQSQRALNKSSRNRVSLGRSNSIVCAT
jgi:hypothetical protein